MTELNVTSSAWQIATSTGSWGGTMVYMGLFIFLPLALFLMGFAVLWNLASYTRFKKYLGWLGGTFKYALIGCLSVGVLAIPAGLLYWGYTQAKQGNVVPLKYVGYGILIYAGLALLGWFVSKFIVKRVEKFEKQLDKVKGGLK